MVNITVLVRDRFILTAQTLVSLRKTQETANVTIFDDRSGDKTRNLVDEWCLATENRSVRNDNAIGTGQARNLVIHASEVMWGRTGYLYLSDNDVVFSPGWMKTLIYCYEAAWKKGFRVVGAYNHPYHVPGPGVKVGRMTESGAKFYEVQEVNALALQSMLMRWCVWDDYGPFCDTPVDKVCQSEDVDFTNKIHAAGYKIGVVAPALVVSTGITNTFGEKIPGWELVKAQAPAGVIVE
jgi:GT2 family glycosyltransferase